MSSLQRIKAKAEAEGRRQEVKDLLVIWLLVVRRAQKAKGERRKVVNLYTSHLTPHEKAEGRRQKAEGRGQRAEGRRQKAKKYSTLLFTPH